MIFILLIAAIIAYAVGATALGAILSVLFAATFLGALVLGSVGSVIGFFSGKD